MFLQPCDQQFFGFHDVKWHLQRSAIRCRDAIRIGGVAYFSDCIFLCPGKGSVNKDLHKRVVFTDLVALGRKPESWTSGPHGPQNGVVESERRGSGRIVGNLT